MNTLLSAFEEIQNILGICPCCGELFKLSDAKLVLPKQKPKPSLYSNLLKMEGIAHRALDDVTKHEVEFEEEMEEVRKERIEAGRLSALEKLRKVDPHFSASGVDPRTCKAIFHPVEHIVFHCIDDTQKGGIEFLSREPRSRYQEIVLESVSRTIEKGAIEYHLLRVGDDGEFSIETELPKRGRKRKSAI